MPAMSEARKLGSAAAKVGFDWASAGDVLAKGARRARGACEQSCCRRPLTAAKQAPHREAVAIEEEFGDLSCSR